MEDLSSRIERALLCRRLGSTMADAVKSDDELRAEIRGELLAQAEARGRARYHAESIPAETTAERRQAERYAACISAGLTMPTDDYRHLPRGIGRVAQSLGISRQALAEDLKAHICRLNGRRTAGASLPSPAK